jgi:hypothetical protein
LFENSTLDEGRWLHFVGCHDCGIETECSYTIEGARASWNRRADDAPKWTTEVPTEAGYYWRQHGDNRQNVVEIYRWAQDGQLWIASTSHRDHIHVSKHIENAQRFGYTPYWLKLELPALPEEGGKDE